VLLRALVSRKPSPCPPGGETAAVATLILRVGPSLCTIEARSALGKLRLRAHQVDRRRRDLASVKMGVRGARDAETAASRVLSELRAADGCRGPSKRNAGEKMRTEESERKEDIACDRKKDDGGDAANFAVRTSSNHLRSPLPPLP
jgi:hypothetical protein